MAECSASALKRRKIRKGTQSCWECKRRKTRCIFAAPSEPVCAGCKARRTKCISQEFEYQVRLANEKAERLHQSDSVVLQPVGNSSNGKRSVQLGQSDTSERNPATRNNVKPSAYQMSSIQDISIWAGEGNMRTNGHHDICRLLLAHWPSQDDLDRVISFPMGLWRLLHGVAFGTSSDSLEQGTLSPREVLRLPPLGSHPVLFARKFLLLGICLQSILTCSNKKLSDPRVSYRNVMFQVVDAAVRLVTSNDELVQSIEGIECIMLESMYHNDTGDLQRAYLTLRRGITIARMMGLHCAKHSSQPMMLESQTRDRIDLPTMWFRLVQSDRYLSLMLGLPQASTETPFASPELLERCTPSEQLERMHVVAAGQILQRNESNMRDNPLTRTIDKLLQDAAACMPPQWWLLPNLSSNGDDEPGRFVQQLPHYFLLMQLHLPYLLCSRKGHGDGYSKITAVNASREILTRFIAFRTLPTTGSYCHGIYCIAFMAGTVLCLAHIVARLRNQGAVDFDGGVHFDHLIHQHPGDCGLMERMLQLLDQAARDGDHAIGSKITNALRPLLAIEETVGREAGYKLDVLLRFDEKDLEYNGMLSDTGDLLYISIPHIGKIHFHRDAVPNADLLEPVIQSGVGCGAALHSSSDPLIDLGPMPISVLNCRNSSRRSEQLEMNRDDSRPSNERTWISSDTTPWDAGGGYGDFDGVDVALFNDMLGELVPSEDAGQS